MRAFERVRHEVAPGSTCKYVVISRANVRRERETSHMLDMMQRDTALDCEPGVIRLFGAADIGSRGMVSGWSAPEEGHAWNDGPEASYCISVRPPLGRFVLIV